MSSEKFDIVIVAGQSNAEGTGTGSSLEPYVPTENIMMVIDDGKPRFETDGEGKVHFVIDYPTPMTLCVAQEKSGDDPRGQLQLSFAREYYEKHLKGTDRKLLIVQCGVGGTGFCRNEWGTDGAILYDRLVRMTQYALDLNEENRIVAFLWHQGECDSFENADWTPEQKYAAHKKNLVAMLDAFCSRFGCEGLPVIAASFCNEWYQKNKVPCDGVLRAIREAMEDRNGCFIDASKLKSNNEETGNGDDIHFSRESLRQLGKLYFQAFQSKQK